MFLGYLGRPRNLFGRRCVVRSGGFDFFAHRLDSIAYASARCASVGTFCRSPDPAGRDILIVPSFRVSVSYEDVRFIGRLEPADGTHLRIGCVRTHTTSMNGPLSESESVSLPHGGRWLQILGGHVNGVFMTAAYISRTARGRRPSRAKIFCRIPWNFCAGVRRSRQRGAGRRAHRIRRGCLRVRPGVDGDGVHHRADLRLPYKSRGDAWCVAGEKNRHKGRGDVRRRTNFRSNRASALILFVASGVEGGYNFAAAGLGANGYGAHSPGLYSMPAAFVAEVIVTTFLASQFWV